MNNPFLSRYVWLQNISQWCIMYRTAYRRSCKQLPCVVFEAYVLYYTGRPINRPVSHETQIPWYPCPALPCPACDTVLERPMCCHGSGAPAIPSMIAISTCSRKKTCSPPKHCFHINIFTGMCVRMYVCVAFLSVVWIRVWLFHFSNSFRRKSMVVLFFFRGWGGLSVCVCVPMLLSRHLY